MRIRTALTGLLCGACLVLGATTGGRAQAPPGPPLSQEPSGALRVKTDITGVQIVLDAEEKGTTPATIRGLAPGPHRLALVKDGYEVHEQTITITAGTTELVTVTMKPLALPPPQLPAVFRALHQHRFGFCVGTLTVTADAIEYAGDTKEDVFRIPIRTLRSVSRSFGRVPGVPGSFGLDGSADIMACRVEAPDRFYGFWAVEKGPDDKVEVMIAKTKELFQVVYRLWTDTLKQPGK